MARRKKDKENMKLSNHNSDITGIILITIAALMIISIFSSSSGIIGGVIKKFIFFLVGIGAYIFPLFFIFAGICFIMKKGNITLNKKFYGIMIFLVNSLLVTQRANMYKYYRGDWMNGLVEIYNSSSVIHGGIFAYIIDIPMYKLFGNIGCYIIYISIYIISLILIFKVSLYDIITKFKLPKLNIKKEDKNSANDKPIIEELITQNNTPSVNAEKDSFIKNINDKIKIIDFMKSTEAAADENIEYEGKAESSNLKSQKQNYENKDVDQIIKDELEDELNKSSLNAVVEYIYPSIDLLNNNVQAKLNKEDKKELISNANKLVETLSNFGVEAKVLQVTKGPSVTRFELQPSPGIKVSKIVNLADDIALSLAASGVRIEAPIPGKSAIGIEVPNKHLIPVYIREVIESDEFKNSNKNLCFAMGKDISGKCVVSDLTKMPHLLIAGATGSGKSVCINTLIISLIYKYSPENVKLLMVDPKVVELNVYNGIPHLLIPVVTDPKKAAGALNWAVNEMTRRYNLFAENNVRNIESYNDMYDKGKIEAKLPWIVIIIDELSDLMMVCPNDVEDYIVRLSQMARAAGMHLVIATQRPSVDVITGVIKANIPSRISFAVSSQIDSRTILDMPGAEKLLGKGDMLFYPVGESKPIRVQGGFIAEEEVEKVVEFIKCKGNIEPKYQTEILEQIDTSISNGNSSNDRDELFDEAVKIVIESNQASTSLVQRRLRIGYNRAARIIEQMEEEGIISSRDGSKPREVLVNKYE